MGSGLRLLPMIGGMLIGMIVGTRLASPRKAADRDGSRRPRWSARGPWSRSASRSWPIAMVLGAFTTVTSSGTGYAVMWFGVAGLGLGLAMPQSMNVALSALSAERSGSGSALITAARQVGATIGVAILGTLISNAYQAGVSSARLSASVAATARRSVTGGVAIAHALKSAALLDEVRTAFVHGMDIMLWTCGGIALAAALLGFAFLPRRSPSGQPAAAVAADGPADEAAPRMWLARSGRGRISAVTDTAGHCGLRERKKARTRAAIREHALRLFRAQGYAATTVEQIAAAAEVSPSTFFRYFPTKEDVVLRDDFDDRMFEAMQRQPPSVSPVAALRAGIREALETLTPAEWAEFQEMTALGLAIPEVRARMMDELTRTINKAAEALATRLDRSPEDLAVRVYAGAVFGVLMAAMARKPTQKAASTRRSSSAPTRPWRCWKAASHCKAARRAPPNWNVEGSNSVRAG